MSAGLDRVVEWIRARHPGLDTIDRDLDLIDHRYVDSLRLLEFIALIEQLTGKPIDLETVELDSFRSLANIERNYFATTLT